MSNPFDHLVIGSEGFLGRALMAALPNPIGVDLPLVDVRLTRDGDPGPYCIDTEVWNAGAKTVWHLAALNGSTAGFYEKPWAVLHTQIAGTLNVIEACVSSKVKTLVLFSSSEVFQNAPTPTHELAPFSIPEPNNPRFSYAMGKQASELLALHSAIPCVQTVRPFNVYGPGQREGHVVSDLIRRIDEAPLGHSVQVHGPADARRAFIYIDDFIAGCLAIAEKHASDETCRETYNVGAMASTSIGRLAELLSGVMGREDVLFSYGPSPHGSVEDRCPDTTKIRMGTGWGAKVGLREGLARTVAAYREARQ